MRRFVPMLALAMVLATSAPASAGHAGAPSATKPPVPCPGCWIPAPGTTWQWNLSQPVNPRIHAELFDIDAFDNSAALVQQLHDDGKKVYCYIDAGSWEDWRPDAGTFPEIVLGNDYFGWPGERWLDVRRIRLLSPIMLARIRLCAAKGFDGAQFDNIEGWDNPTGFHLTRADDLRYAIWLTNHAHHLGLGAAIENALALAPTLVDYTEWQISEECSRWHECDAGRIYLDAGKLYGDVEYGRAFADLSWCDTLPTGAMGMFKHLSLGPFRVPCP